MWNLVFLFYVCVEISFAVSSSPSSAASKRDGVFEASSERDGVFEASVIRGEKVDSFQLVPCRPKDTANVLQRRDYCEQILGGLIRNCHCDCPEGTVAYPNSPTSTCRPLEDLRSPYALPTQLSTSLRSFAPLSTIELEIPFCAADDPSLLHLDCATLFGWKDFVDVDIRVYSFIDKISGFPTSVVRFFSGKSSWPQGQLFRLQFTAPCIYSQSGPEKHLRGDFIYFVTTGRSRIPYHRSGEPSRRPRDNDKNNDGDRDYFDFYAEKYDLEYDSGFPSTHSGGGAKSGAGLAVPFIGVIVIAVVVAFIFIIISVKLMKSYCCLCKNDEDEDVNEPEVNPFKDYSPSKGNDAVQNNNNAAPPLVRERAVTTRRNAPAACSDAQHLATNDRLTNDRVMNAYDRTPGVSQSADFSISQHIYESLDSVRGSRVGEEIDERPPDYEESIRAGAGGGGGGGGEETTLPLPYYTSAAHKKNEFQVLPVRSRRDYLSWSGLNQNHDPESEPEPDLNPTTEAAPRHLPVPSRLTHLPTSMPKSLPPSPPKPSRRHSSTLAKGLSPIPRDPNINGQSCNLDGKSFPIDPKVDGQSMVSLVRGHELEGFSRAPSLEHALKADRNESCFRIEDDNDNNDDGVVPPQRRQSIHNLPPSIIIPRFKIEGGGESSTTGSRLRQSLKAGKKSSFVYFSQSSSGAKLSSSSSNDNVFFGDYANSRVLASTTDRFGGSSIITHDGSSNQGTRI